MSIQHFLIPALSVALCTNFAAMAEPSRHPLKVGVSLSLTGAAGLWAKYQWMGAQLAKEELNQKGYNIELVIEDTRTEPKSAVSAFRKLVEVDRVRGVIGDIFSYLTEPLIPLADQAKVVLISPATPASFCEKTKGFFFSAATQVPLAKAGYAAFLRRNPVNRLALVYFQDPGWGHQYRDGWRALAEENNVKIVGEVESAEFNPDFRALLPRLIAKHPEAFFVAQQPDSFIIAARALGYSGPIVFANNVLEIAALGGEKAQLVDGIYFVDTVAVPDFVERFKARFGEAPLLEAYTGYEALHSMVQAIVADPAHPADALRQLRYRGVSGMLDFTKSCAGNESTWHLKRFNGQRIEIIE